MDAACADAHPPEIIVEHSGNLATKVLQKMLFILQITSIFSKNRFTLYNPT